MMPNLCITNLLIVSKHTFIPQLMAQHISSLNCSLPPQDTFSTAIAEYTDTMNCYFRSQYNVVNPVPEVCNEHRNNLTNSYIAVDHKDLLMMMVLRKSFVCNILLALFRQYKQLEYLQQHNYRETNKRFLRIEKYIAIVQIVLTVISWWY